MHSDWKADADKQHEIAALQLSEILFLLSRRVEELVSFARIRYKLYARLRAVARDHRVNLLPRRLVETDAF